MRRLIAARILLLCNLHIRVKSTLARFVILSSRLAWSSYARLRLSSSLSPSLPLLALCRFSLYASCAACRCQARLVTSNHLARLSPFPSPPLPSLTPPLPLLVPRSAHTLQYPTHLVISDRSLFVLQHPTEKLCSCLPYVLLLSSVDLVPFPPPRRH